jgi:hypothetical protein
MIYTVLEMTQRILSAMDSDEVDSISDTVESTQVALMLKQTFYDCASDLELPQHEGFFELNASGDAAKPTLMTTPSNVFKVRSIRYNNILATTLSETNPNYREVEYIKMLDFIDRQQGLREDETNVGVMSFTSNSETFEVMYRTDKMPQFYSTFDDRTFIFDSYNEDEDTTLQKAKTMCEGVVYPTWTMDDSFTPDLSPQQFSYFLNKAIDRAFVELKQQQNANAAGEARKQLISLQKQKGSAPDRPKIWSVPRYGRLDGQIKR